MSILLARNNVVTKEKDISSPFIFVDGVVVNYSNCSVPLVSTIYLKVGIFENMKLYREITNIMIS